MDLGLLPSGPTMLHNLTVLTKSALLASTSQLGPVLALVAAIAIAGIAIVIDSLKKN